jgi:hypothetical protein
MNQVWNCKTDAGRVVSTLDHFIGFAGGGKSCRLSFDFAARRREICGRGGVKKRRRFRAGKPPPAAA